MAVAKLMTNANLLACTTGKSGIVVVAAFAANAGGFPPLDTITATCRRTRPAANSGSRLS